MAVQFFLSLLLCMSFCQAPPFSYISEVNATEKQREQVIKKEENIHKGGGDIIHDARKEVDVFSPLMLYSRKWRNIKGKDCTNLWKKVQSLFSPQPHLPTIPVRVEKVGMKWNVNNISTTSNTSTTTAPVTTTTASIINPSALPHIYPSLLPPSSCSSVAREYSVLLFWWFCIYKLSSLLFSMYYTIGNINLAVIPDF